MAGEVGDKNAFVVGTREDNTILARHFGEGDVPAGVDYLERTRIFRGTSTPHSSPKPHFK